MKGALASFFDFILNRKSKKVIRMVQDWVLCSIRNLVEFVENKMRKSYEQSKDEDKRWHIYNDARTVRDWLDEG